jgi:hypothetical protein
MFFCQSCSKVLDEDLKVCPYCGAYEEGFTPSEPVLDDGADSGSDDTAADLDNSLDLLLDKAVISSGSVGSGSGGSVLSFGGVDPFSDSTAPVLGDAPLASGSGASLDETISKINDMIESKQQNALSASASNDASYSYYPPKEDEEISTGLKAGLIVLAVFIPFAGLIIGIIYMTKTGKKQKSFGKTLLIISISLMALSFICCCGIYAALMFNNGFFY